jgi:hypothetical protein
VLRFSVDVKVPIAESAGSSLDSCSSLLSKEPGAVVVSLLRVLLSLLP